VEAEARAEAAVAEEHERLAWEEEERAALEADANVESEDRSADASTGFFAWPIGRGWIERMDADCGAALGLILPLRVPPGGGSGRI